jgi:hypothetical protein
MNINEQIIQMSLLSIPVVFKEVFRATRILNADCISKKIRTLPPYNL